MNSPSRARTYDTLVNSQLLCLLSYRRIMVTDAFVIRRLLKGFEPLTFRLQGDCAAYCATRANKKYLYSNIVLLKLSELGNRLVVPSHKKAPDGI